jgi:hypothetical protein
LVAIELMIRPNLARIESSNGSRVSLSAALVPRGRLFCRGRREEAENRGRSPVEISLPSRPRFGAPSLHPNRFHRWYVPCVSQRAPLPNSKGTTPYRKGPAPEIKEPRRASRRTGAQRPRFPVDGSNTETRSATLRPFGANTRSISSRPYKIGGSIHLVDPQGSHWKMVADLPCGSRDGMCANWRIGTAHFSQCGGAVLGPNIPQTISGTAARSAQYCSLSHGRRSAPWLRRCRFGL